MDKSQLLVDELTRNIFILIQRESQRAALPDQSDKYEPSYADSAITSNVPRELVDNMRECVKKYSKKFDKGGTSTSQVMRVLVHHFLENWESLPMEKAWFNEENRKYIVSSNYKSRIRLTLSGL